MFTVHRVVAVGLRQPSDVSTSVRMGSFNTNPLFSLIHASSESRCPLGQKLGPYFYWYTDIPKTALSTRLSPTATAITLAGVPFIKLFRWYKLYSPPSFNSLSSLIHPARPNNWNRP